MWLHYKFSKDSMSRQDYSTHPSKTECHPNIMVRKYANNYRILTIHFHLLVCQHIPNSCAPLVVCIARALTAAITQAMRLSPPRPRRRLDCIRLSRTRAMAEFAHTLPAIHQGQPILRIWTCRTITPCHLRTIALWTRTLPLCIRSTMVSAVVPVEPPLRSFLSLVRIR